MKGVGEMCKTPNFTIGEGFLAIEKVEEATVVVLRMDTGRVAFSGIVAQTLAKTKIMTNEDKPEGEGEYRLKFIVAVRSKDQEPKGYVQEYCVASFLSREDRDNFIKVYKPDDSEPKEPNDSEEKK